MSQHEGLPVAGYRPQTSTAVALVNEMKFREEVILQVLDDLSQDPSIDQRWLAIGRTNLEQAFMAINRSVFKPRRVELPSWWDVPTKEVPGIGGP